MYTRYSHTENDKILDVWNEISIKNGEGEIEYDGVAYKGEVKAIQSSNGSIMFQRQPGNEESNWNNSSKRILFVAKELNDVDVYDSRVVVNFDPENGIVPSHKFIKNMLFITKGLLESTKELPAEFPVDEDMDILMKSWDKAAVAKINVKKQPGGSSADMNSVAKAADTYKELLKKQLHLLDANIIVCCDSKNIILSTIKDIEYPNAIQINDYVWYDNTKETILISSYHLSARKTYEDVYERVVRSFVDALAKIKS